MGILRFESKNKEPGFARVLLSDQLETKSLEEPVGNPISFEATIRLITRQGTIVQVSREVPLKQVARLVRMLDGSLRV